MLFMQEMPEIYFLPFFRMAASVSSTGSDEDRTRFFRLSLIIIDQLTQILRDLLHNEVSPTQIFKKVMKVNHLTKSLRKDQIAIIRDANTRGYQDFDITLLYTLLRNVCQNITPPSQGWGVSTMPSPNEVTVGDDIERIRLIRNKLFGHISEAAISKTEFKRYLSIISGICTRIQTLLNKDYVKRLQDAEERSIDPDTEEKYLQLIKRQAEEERAIRDLLQSALAQGNANRDMLQNLQISITGNNDCIQLTHYREPYSFATYYERKPRRWPRKRKVECSNLSRDNP